MFEKILVVAAIAMAAWWLLKRYLRKFSSEEAGQCCSGCQGCDSDKICDSYVENKGKTHEKWRGTKLKKG
jgi:positive regulator of sigma E activity